MNLLQFPNTADAATWSAFLTGLTDGAIDTARAAYDELRSGAVADALAVAGIWNRGDIALGNAFGVTSTIGEVHPVEAVREAAEAAQQRLTTVVTERDQDPELAAVITALAPPADDPEAARLIERIARDFSRAGVDRPAEVRNRIKEILDRETVLEQDFSRNVRTDTRSIRITPERLAGLPEDYRAAHPAGDDGLVEITTDYPDLVPFLSYAADAQARRELATVDWQRAYPANDAVLAELIALRHERATLLGFDSWPDFDADVKMIGTGAAIGAFIDKIADLALEPGRRDYDVLLRRAQADDPAIAAISRAERAFYAQAIARENYSVDSQEVRQYFTFDAVRAGLLEVTGKLFGIGYVPVPDAARWHEDVAVYDVVRGSGEGKHGNDGGVETIGRIYLDLFPRDGKYKHAAQFDLRGGVSGVQLPEGALVCNFSRTLMEHDEVVTLFHEFGHLVHHILGGGQRFVRFSGVATEWDFVEAPSQLLEEWAWDADVLRSFATNDAGEPIPAELVARMRAAEEFGKGLQARTQMFYAAQSYQLYLQRPADQTALVEELQRKYDLLAPLSGSHQHASFGHLVGYSSGYYTYMWSLVIAKDMFSAFDRSNMFDPQIAGRYRDAVLAPGGRADAAELVADFLGREYDFAAFGEWLTS